MTYNLPSSDKSVREHMPGERDLMMSGLCAAAAHLKLGTHRVKTICLALRQKRGTCAQALEWRKAEGLVKYLSPEVRS